MSSYSKTTQEQTSHSETKSGSTTTGGSTSKNTGGSTSKTTGGSSSSTTGRQYAAGKVDPTTQANRNKYMKDYQQSSSVSDIYKRLQTQLKSQPGAFSSPYTSQLDAIYQKIVNREPFSYNFNADPVYQQYKANYIASGKNAMKDTVATITALTGGYGNSYAQTAGQQTYQQYLTELNNILPQLEQQNYQRYQDEGANLQNQYSITSDRYGKDYQKYRDLVADYRSDRDYLTNLYQSERSFDYNKYTANRAFWNDEYWKQRNADMRTESKTNTRNWSQTDTSNWSQTDTSNWSKTDSWSTTDGKTTTTSETNAWSAGGGSGGGGGGGGGRSSSSSSTRLTGKEALLANVKAGKTKSAQQQLLNQYVKRGDQSVADLRWVAQQLGLDYYGASRQVTGSGGNVNKNVQTIM